MIYVVRHGRTASNASGLLLGHADPPLDDTGDAQAARLGRALSPEAGAPVARVISSPLLRTRSTAEHIAAANGLEVDVDERFIELDYGDWDQQPLASIRPAQWRVWQADDDFSPPGGESLNELQTRVSAAMDSLLEEAGEHDLAIVTHVSPIKAIVSWALDVGVGVSWRMFVTPASITRVSVGQGRPSLHGFNDRAHLADL